MKKIRCELCLWHYHFVYQLCFWITASECKYSLIILSNINAIYFHEILWYKEIARHKGHERDNVTHGVDTVYFLRNFSQKQWVLHNGRLLWGPWVDFVSRSDIYGKKNFFCCSGGIINFSIWPISKISWKWITKKVYHQTNEIFDRKIFKIVWNLPLLENHLLIHRLTVNSVITLVTFVPW